MRTLSILGYALGRAGVQTHIGGLEKTRARRKRPENCIEHMARSNDDEFCICKNLSALPHHGTENPFYPCEQRCGNVVTNWETMGTVVSLCPLGYNRHA